MQAEVEIRAADFDVGAEYAALTADAADSGACVVFTGRVRGVDAGRAVEALHLEHYPGMTESSIAAIVAEARARWRIARVRVIHRIGRLPAGAQIVLVGVASAHRGDAFAACEFLMDYLKTRAPLWKQELGSGGSRWVESHAKDAAAAARWNTPNDPTDTSKETA